MTQRLGEQPVDAETGYGAARDGDLDEAPEQVQPQAHEHASERDDLDDAGIEGERG